MKIFVVATLAAGALALSNPAICPGNVFTELICADIGGLENTVCIDAEDPPMSPRNLAQFRKICSRINKQAACAVVSAIDQAQVCREPPVSQQ